MLSKFQRASEALRVINAIEAVEDNDENDEDITPVPSRKRGEWLSRRLIWDSQVNPIFKDLKDNYHIQFLDVSMITMQVIFFAYVYNLH